MPWACGLFVAAGAVNLPGQVQALNALDAQRAVQLCSVHAVIFDGISRTQHLGRLQPGNRAHNLPLHLHGQRGGHAVDVDLVSVEALRLQKKLVLRLVGKLDDLVFDGRAIARPDAINLPGIHRRAMHIFANQAEGFRRGERDVATYLRLHNFFGSEAEGRGVKRRPPAPRTLPSEWCDRRAAAASRS